MKSTYKLFGTFWDGMSAVKPDHLHITRILFLNSDFISFKALLSVRDATDYDNLIKPFQTSEQITVGVDFWADTSNPVICAFLRKRLCQMVSHLSVSFVDVRCVQT